MKLIRAVGIILLLWAAGLAQAETLNIFGDEAYAPVVYLRAGEPAGVLPRLLSRIEAITGDHYHLKLFPWKRSYELAARGEGAIIGLTRTHARLDLFDFSGPLYDDDIQIVTLRERSFTYSGIGDLQGKAVGGVHGASYGDEADEAIARGVLVIERDKNQNAQLRKLLAGRLDAVLVGNGQAGLTELLGSEDLRAGRDRFQALPKPLISKALHLAFAKPMHKQAVLARFDKALERLRKSGELAFIVAHPNS
jgi:ABC-type amino acid transport substrate-binding protein